MSMYDQGGYRSGDVPPVMAGDLPMERAKWPTVLGWFSIVLGGLGILKNGCGAVSNLLFGGGMGMSGMFGGGAQAEQQRQAMEKAMAGMGPWIILVGVLGLVSFVISIVLLVAGIQMVHRKPSSVGLHKGWAWVRILMVLVEAAATAILQSAMMKAMVSNMPQGGSGGPSPAAMGQMMMVFGLAGACITVLFGLAYPIVVLIVLAKRWAKEEVARWGGARMDDGAAFR